MELAVGIEPRQEYLSFEVALGARKLVEHMMLTKPGENLVVTADTSTDWRVVQATAKAAYAAGAVPTVLWYETRPNAVMEPPAPVAGAVQRADVWIEFAYAYTLHTPAFKAAMEAGARYICLTGMDVEMMVKTIARVDIPKLINLGNTLVRLVAAADEVRITSPAGTDLVANTRGRLVRQSGRLAENKGEPVMLGGQVSWSPVEETINGRLVFDGALFPPMELGALRNPVALTLEKGAVTRIEGGYEAQVFQRWMKSFNDEKMYWLAHYSLGFNPGVPRPTGRIVEDERSFGCIEMGIGSQGKHLGGKYWSAASHTDGIVLNPSIYLDGVAIEKEGVYVHPDLIRACQELGVPGY